MTIVARDIMKTELVSVQPSTPLTELENTLIGRHIGGAPVIENGRLLGIVSRSDIVRYFTIQRSLADMFGKQAAAASAEQHKGDPHLTVRDIMAEAVVQVAPDTPIADVANLMVDRHVHRVLVTEEDKVVGLISALDIARLVGEKQLSALHE